MEWSNEYQAYYNDVVKRRLSKKFIKIYEKNCALHDRYLRSFYFANTGSKLLTYSKKGLSTIQIQLDTEFDSEDILLMYKNVRMLMINHDETENVSFCALTGIGSCLVSQFAVFEDGSIKHEMEFEGGTIAILCEDVQIKILHNHYWKN
jgi:hypothetical protein